MTLHLTGLPLNRRTMWSFNLRARNDGSSDDDDDDDQGEARLIREMDRHETVEYRPNPWRIARINAASRPPARSPPKPIVEAFKKQAQRQQQQVAAKKDPAHGFKFKPAPVRRVRNYPAAHHSSPGPPPASGKILFNFRTSVSRRALSLSAHHARSYKQSSFDFHIACECR